MSKISGKEQDRKEWEVKESKSKGIKRRNCEEKMVGNSNSNNK